MADFMKIAQGIEALEITANVMSRQSVIYPTLIWDDENVVLIDAGFPGLLPAISEAMSGAGVPLERLNKVLITHQDIDHIGSLSSILEASENKIEVVAHEIEKPYIQGDKPLLKLANFEKRANSTPEPLRSMFENMIKNPPKAPVDKTVVDGEELPDCGGITVIFTPGHTTGHTCYYHKSSKTLIAGDALVVEDGILHGPRAQVSADIETANKSLEKLMDFDIETIVCYHGGVYNKNVNERIAEIISGK
jgi:glyoxylase-like metal-dependent hydrolase (beta-lactamase superfamily II)